MSRSVSSREVRLRDHDELDWTLPCESSVHGAPVCPVKCGELTVKKKRVETFRNIRYGDGRIYNIERCRSSWGEPERGRADIGTQAGMHKYVDVRTDAPSLLAACLALSRVPIVCT